MLSLKAKMMQKKQQPKNDELYRVKMSQILFLLHFNGFILHRTFVIENENVILSLAHF